MKKDLQFRFKINTSSDVPKFRQLIDSVNQSIASNTLQVGDVLPSVNSICNDYQLSRDTVFKAYTILKEQGVVESVPNKGYFIAQEIKKVFVLLDTFKAYKEVLYDSFVKNLPKNVIADVHFHHYNPQNTIKLIQESIGKYSKYVVMPFDDLDVNEAIKLFPIEKLLVIDWKVNSTEQNNVLYQDFGQSVVDGLEGILHLLKKYNEMVFLYPEYTNHPIESVEYFKKFCKNHHIKYSVLTDSTQFQVKSGVAYFSVSDRLLGRFLEECRSKKLEPGIDTGIISYNETPMKKFIYKGITVFSTNFELMGRKAAEFVVSESPMNYCVPSTIAIRESL